MLSSLDGYAAHRGNLKRGDYYQSLSYYNLKMDADDRLWRRQWISHSSADLLDI